MSTAVMSTTPMFECSEHLFKNAASTKTKESSSTSSSSTSNGTTGHNVSNGHAPLKRYTSLMTSLIEQHRKLDRSVSEPTSRYKTELCRPYEENGSCKYGDKCQFAHGYAELRNLARHPKYKTELCRTFHTIGFCPYGPRCHFIHNFEEARIHNQKVAAQLTGGSTPANLIGLNPLMSAAAAAAAASAVNGIGAAASNISVSLLEQLAASSQVAAAAATAAATTTSSLMRANSLSLNSTGNVNAYNQPAPLLRTSSLSLGTNHHHHHVAAHHHVVNSVIGATKPKPLNLSPTFSLSSSADSVSPSSSLSQSPTNSIPNFFGDDGCSQQTTNLQTTPFSFGQDFSLLPCSRQSPSPRNNGVCSHMTSDEAMPPLARTPSPLSPNTESRLPVFNRISSALSELDNLKI